jgi:hypothetical protein
MARQLPSLDKPRRVWWRLPLLLAIVLAAIMWSQLHKSNNAPQLTVKPANVASDRDPINGVSLTIDFGDNKRRIYPRMKCYDGMTVADLLDRSSDLPFQRIGAGESAMLTELGGVPNEGAGGRNWIFSVNGKDGDKSFEIYQLHPQDKVLWSFVKPK